SRRRHTRSYGDWSSDVCSSDLQYLEAWLRGNGCVPLYHLMEDAATAEICRAQLWQWLRHGARTSDGQLVTVERFDRLLSAELDRIHDEVGAARLANGVFPTAASLFEQMTKSETFDGFLSLQAYGLLIRESVRRRA